MGASCAKEAKPVDTAPPEPEHRGLRAGLVQAKRSTSIWETYDRGEELGRGMTGTVYTAFHRITGQKYALKCMERRKISQELMTDLRNEVSLLQTLDHPNVIKLSEFYEDDDNLYLLLEYCSGGELYDRLHQQTNRAYTEPEAARLVFKMLSAIAYCHRLGVSHRDLKLENFIFVTKDVDSDLKLIDFGLSKKYASGIRRMNTMVGTPYYMAPEVLDTKKSTGYTQACDVWSIGVITYMLLSGTPPFKGHSDNQVLDSVRSAKLDMSGRRWDKVSPTARAFIRALLQRDPANRPTAEQALQHPWLSIITRAIDAGKIDDSVLDSLRRFSQYTQLKRLAIETIAFSMNSVQIQTMRRAFVKMDKDRTGFVSEEELISVLVKEGFSPDEAHSIFLVMDRDGRKKISYSEFLAASLDRRYYLQVDRIREAFERLDFSNSGCITASDLKEVMGDDFSEDAVQSMLEEADVAGDCRIDFNEFLRLVADESRHESRKALLPPLKVLREDDEDLDDDGDLRRSMLSSSSGPSAGAGAGAGAAAGAGADASSGGTDKPTVATSTAAAGADAGGEDAVSPSMASVEVPGTSSS